MRPVGIGGVDESVPSQQGLKPDPLAIVTRRQRTVDESVPSQQGLKHPNPKPRGHSEIRGR